MLMEYMPDCKYRLKDFMKYIYCLLWSIGLFVATFYGLLVQENVFDFTDKELLSVAQSHIFPMVMAMALFLLDVLYGSIIRGENDRLVFWTLLMVIAFMVTFVLSLLVNHNVSGWTFFVLAWLSLTILKFKTTDGGKKPCPHIVSED